MNIRKYMPMPHYPLFLDLTDKAVLVVGAGRVGLRKTRGVLACGPAAVTLVDPAPPDAEAAALMAENKAVAYKQKLFEERDIFGKSLVFAATNIHEVNTLIADLCRNAKILCNVADTPTQGDFQVPAHFHEEGVTVAVSTGGASPSLASHLSRELEAFLHGNLGDAAKILKKLRPELQAIDMTLEEKRNFYRSLISSCREQKICLGDKNNLFTALKKILPSSLHKRIQEIMHDF